MTEDEIVKLANDIHTSMIGNKLIVGVPQIDYDQWPEVLEIFQKILGSDLRLAIVNKDE